MRRLLIILLLLSGCRLPEIGKFGTLVPNAAFTGVVAYIHQPGEPGAGGDFDLAPDGEYDQTMAAFPAYHGIIHCETYAHDEFEYGGDGNLLESIIHVGDHVYVEGAFVVDYTVHGEEREKFPERIIQRGIFKAGLPKPEMHPYRVSKVALNPEPLETVAVVASWYREFYFAAGWFPNWFICGSTCGVDLPEDGLLIVGKPRP